MKNLNVKWYWMLLLVLLLVIGMPVAVIWSVNTLFGLTIPLTLQTWLATVILVGVLRPIAKVAN